METGFKVISCLPALSSYPTYKEWKLRNLLLIAAVLFGSYPTYKEWKRSTTILDEVRLFVLILPIRNGNRV